MQVDSALISFYDAIKLPSDIADVAGIKTMLARKHSGTEFQNCFPNKQLGLNTITAYAFIIIET